MYEKVNSLLLNKARVNKRWVVDEILYQIIFLSPIFDGDDIFPGWFIILIWTIFFFTIFPDIMYEYVVVAGKYFDIHNVVAVHVIIRF